MHNPTLLAHFQNPRNAGPLPPPAIIIDAQNPICGDQLRLWILWSPSSQTPTAQIIEKAHFQARGCTAAIACASALTALLEGRTHQALHALTLADIEQAVGGLIPESKHAAHLCRDAIRAIPPPA